METEEKAKAYDKALKVIKDNLDALNEIAETGAKIVNIQTIKNCFYRAFPELKESEDEKIRKALIRTFNELRTNEHINDVLVGDILTWLEKQGEQKQDPCNNCKDVMLNCHNFPCTKKRAFKQGKSLLEVINEEKVDNANKVEPKFRIKYAGSEYNVFEIKNIAGVTFYGIEDEPNHIDYVKAENCEKVDGYSIKENGSTYPTKSAVFSEQTTNDKVEPKFHEGDWLCENAPNNYARFIQILEIVNLQGKERYRISRDIHNDEDIVECRFIENDYHSFTIADAKDGDVLNSPSHHLIWIYKDNEHFYACVNMNYVTENVATNGLIKIPSDACPATKEQRDTLMKAMTDAGYAFDFDKKKLKKIEDETEIPFGAKDSELQEATYYIPKGFYAEIDNDKVVIKKGEKPTAWNEDDDKMLYTIIADFKGFIHNNTSTLESHFNECIDWLKSIKDRVGCEANYTTTKEWKPSDEQMKVLLSEVTAWFKGCSKQKVLKSLYDDLKKLK